MAPEQIFSVLNLLALIGWILLIVLPRQRWIAEVISGAAVPALLAAIAHLLKAPRCKRREPRVRCAPATCPRISPAVPS